MEKRFQDRYGLKWFDGKKIEGRDVAEIAKYKDKTMTVGRFYINHTDTPKEYAIYDRLETCRVCDIKEGELADYLNKHAFIGLPKDERMHGAVNNATYDKLCGIAIKNGLVKETTLTMFGDWIDFKDVSVWSVADALATAYNLGKADAAKGNEPILSKKDSAPEYNYEWKTAEAIIANANTKRRFSGWGETTLARISDNARPDEYAKAHELWLKLKDLFNAEAAPYAKGVCLSKLGSIGDVKDREVMRSAWWAALDGDSYGDYDTLTRIIETLHCGEKLKTGVITFGS